MVLPTINAFLNLSSAALLLTGYYFVKRKNFKWHKRCMLAACGTSLLFLSTYIAYHALHGSMPFQGTGWIRHLYFSILISHSVLAVVIIPMVIAVLIHAAKKNFSSHQRFAQLTLPVWIYVSITGVIIYYMLYLL